VSNRPIGKYVFLYISIGFFLCALAYKFFFITIENTPERNACVVSEKLAQEINSIEGTISTLKSTITTSERPTFNSLLHESKYPYYVFSNKRVIFWSNNLFTPKYNRDVLGEFRLSYLETSKGKYLARKEQFKHEIRSYEIVFLIPLEEEFSIVNEYLKNTYNEKIFTDSNIEIAREAHDEDHQIISIKDQELFSVKFGNTYSNSDQASRSVIIICILLTFIFLSVFIKKQLDEYVKERSLGLGCLFLLSCLLILRSLMLLTGFPFDFVYIDLFDPKHYASSLVNPSLGDLLLNLVSLLFLGFYIFNNFFRSSTVRKVITAKKSTQFIVAVICMFFSFFWLMVHHQTMKTLNFDSQWSMDITQNLDFNYLKLIAFFTFFISVVIYFLFSHVCFRLYLQLMKHDTKRHLATLTAGTILFLVFALAQKFDFEVVIVVNLLFFLTIRFFKLPKYIGSIQYLTFIYLFSFGLPTAIIGLYANIQYDRSNTDVNKSRLADQLLVESNFFTELQLDDVAKQIKDDIFIQQRIFSPYASKLIIEKKIRSEHLNNLDKFDIQVYVFNSRGDPFEQFKFKDNYHDLKSTLGEFKTDSEGLYFINQSRGQATIQYMSFIEIEDRNQVIGYVLLHLKQKRLVPNSVFPLLLNKNLTAQQIEGSEQFSYGVFNGSELQYNYGAFNYRKNFDAFVAHSDVILDQNVRIRGFNHKAYQGEGNRVVIISAREPTIGARYANFSFLFLVYVFSILLILIAGTFYQGLNQVKLNYATKIQLYLNFAFFTPLIIVSVTTMSLIFQTFKASLEHQYREYADNLSGQISGSLSEYRKLELEREEFSDMVFQIAENADLDINVFNNNGRLIASSLFQIYQNEILSLNIDPRAYIKIIEESESAVVQEEQVGLLNYKNVYMGIRSYETGAIIGILSLPFFASKQDLEQNIAEILSNIINIFTFVFIIFLFISFFVSRGLTFPLRLITQKIKRTTLSAYNEPLSWNSEDEIGLMVTEYNRMLLNLDMSKKALAKSEKESAWREMAKQVAHEIKNPLTPMKLTLQHMKRVIDHESDGAPDDKKLKQINVLLEQIETLNGIATSFSDFAKMPEPKTEKLDVSLLLKETIDLYNKKELGKILTNIQEGAFMIEGDRKWLGRAFSNLIINGFQAARDQKSAKIEVNLVAKGNDTVRIEISDNGHGIPNHIQDKVFIPNFSTKYTGSGLGLAITKKGIEHSDGTIWFSSEEGIGTTFYIEIPRA
jgi:two-component system nitrogen regulation sensor histidine kinase NtrY